MFRKIVIGLIALAILAGGGILIFNQGMGEIREMPISQVDLSVIPDGVYTGQFELGRWASEVEVTVVNHQITKIDVVEGEQLSLLESAAEEVVKAQSLQIDAYSGASITTKALLKSVEKALN